MNLIPDITIIPMWFIFMASVIVLNRFVFKPTLQLLAEREKRTEGFQKDVAYFKAETEIKLKEYETLMTDAYNLARNAREEILKSAEAQQKEIINEARQFSNEQLTDIRKQIKVQSDIASKQLKQDSESLAKIMSEELLERKVA